MPLVPREALLATINRYADEFNSHIHRLMVAKLGLNDAREENRTLWIDLLNLIAGKQIDFTLFFRKLSGFDSPTATANGEFRGLFPEPAAWDQWAEQYRQRLAAEGSVAEERRERMNRVNPKFILNKPPAQDGHRQGRAGPRFQRNRAFAPVLRRPFDEQPDMEKYAQPAPEWGKHLVVSCSS